MDVGRLVLDVPQLGLVQGGDLGIAQRLADGQVLRCCIGDGVGVEQRFLLVLQAGLVPSSF